jgi:hypothetical protein
MTRFVSKQANQSNSQRHSKMTNGVVVRELFGISDTWQKACQWDQAAEKSTPGAFALRLSQPWKLASPKMS